MKNTILLLCLLLTTSLVFAQSKVGKKVSAELQKKIQSSPVGFFKNGKSVVNQKVLNPNIYSGEKISSFEIIFLEDAKKYFLVRRAKLKKGYLTSFMPLKKHETRFFATPYLGGNNDLDCFSNSCQSCSVGIGDTGSSFCECVSTGSYGCSEYDHSESSEVRLSSLFR